MMSDEPDKFANLLDATLSSFASELRAHILAGENFEYDRDAIERDEDERRREEEARKPKKRGEIYPGELQRIAEILEVRHHLLQQGKLYRAGDNGEFELADPLRALPVDAVIVWIALRNCLEDPSNAEDYTKTIILRFLNLITPDYPGLPEKTPDDIDTEASRLLVKIHEEEEKWFPRFMVVSFYYLYEIPHDDIQSHDKRKRHIHGRMAVQCTGDAWRLYAQVMNLFGWEIPERWIADPDED